MRLKVKTPTPHRPGTFTHMIWIQSFAALVVWLSYGWTQRQRQERLRQKLESTPRAKLMLYGAGGFIISAAILLIGLWLVSASGGLTPGGLTLGGWFGVALTGLIFVHLQILAAASMIVLVQRGDRV